MRSLPLPLRVAAGLAVTAVERARDLPGALAGLPVTVVSQALQASMRLQQQVTELAIKGDEVLAALRPAEENPEWATFDEDIDEDAGAVAPARASAFDRVTDADSPDDLPDDDLPDFSEDVSGDAVPEDGDDPWSAEERAIAGAPADPPASAAGYDELSLPQLRARLRQYSAEELAELLAYERATENRPSFVGMLTRRIATVRDQT